MGRTKAPILLIGFNRPDTMQKVFDEVRKAKPLKLYYAVDCAREGKAGEAEKVSQVKAIVKKVDWSCEVHTLFQKENRGCGYGPAEAITWAFENEDRLIVLEDDCVPSQSFFRFCDEMLERYKDDERVNIISGRSHHSGSKFFKDKDYIFTHYAHTWGWATWKRAWNEFDIKMSDWPDFMKDGGFLNILSSEKEGKYFNNWINKIYQHIEEECTHSWDAQWVYARLKNGGLGIVPAHNLIMNIGSVGTHTSEESECHRIIAQEIPESLTHPKFITYNYQYEREHFNSKFTPLYNIQKVYQKMISMITRFIK